MKLVKKVTNIRLEGIYDNFNEPIVRGTDNEIYDLRSLKIIYQSSKYCGIIHYLDSFVVCIDKEELDSKLLIKWFLIDKKTFDKIDLKEIISKPDIFYFKYFDDIESFIVKDINNDKVVLIDRLDNIKWELPNSDLNFTHRYMHKFVIIPFQKKSIIRCIDLEEGQEEWTVDISEIGRRILPSGKVELGKVHSPKVKLYENIAVIPILSWGTIGIDINTGDILWQLSHPSTYINYQYGQYLYTVGDNIIEFDAKSGLVLRSKPITDVLDMLNVDIKSATRAVQGVSVSEKYIIYGNRGYVWIISRSTLELIETVEIEAQGSVYSGSPLYHDGMLYIVDGLGHLHVIQDEV